MVVIEWFSQMINALGPVVVLPLVVAALGLLFGQKPAAAVRSGLLLAIGFMGIFLMVDLMAAEVSGIGQSFAERTGTGLDIIDVGWPTAASISFSTAIGSLIIPLGIIVNILLLVAGITDTLSVDIWGYWHMAFVGTLVQFTTGSLALGIFASVISIVITLLIADWSAPLLQHHFGMKGVSFPNLATGSFMLAAVPFAVIINRFDFLKNLDLNPRRIEKSIGILGEPVMLGFIIGTGLAFAAGYPAERILTTGITIAAVMVLMPKMVEVLMDGLIPVAEASQVAMARRFPKRKFYIGIDPAVLARDPSVIASGLLMVPVFMMVAIALAPFGNRTLPFIDLADGPYMIAMVVGLVVGDVLLSLILAAFVLSAGMIFTTLLAPTVTQMIAASHIPIEITGNYTLYTVMGETSIPTVYGTYYAMQMPPVTGIALLTVAAVSMYWLKKTYPLGKRLLVTSAETDMEASV